MMEKAIAEDGASFIKSQDSSTVKNPAVMLQQVTCLDNNEDEGGGEGLGGCMVDTTATDGADPEEEPEAEDPNKRILRTRRRKINYRIH